MVVVVVVVVVCTCSAPVGSLGAGVELGAELATGVAVADCSAKLVIVSGTVCWSDVSALS